MVCVRVTVLPNYTPKLGILAAYYCLVIPGLTEVGISLVKH